MVRTSTGWSGHNTDVGGCVRALRATGLDQVRRAAVGPIGQVEKFKSGKVEK